LSIVNYSLTATVSNSTPIFFWGGLLGAPVFIVNRLSVLPSYTLFSYEWHGGNPLSNRLRDPRKVEPRSVVVFFFPRVCKGVLAVADGDHFSRKTIGRDCWAAHVFFNSDSTKTCPPRPPPPFAPPHLGKNPPFFFWKGANIKWSSFRAHHLAFSAD